MAMAETGALAQALSISQRMVEVARAGQWDELPAMESQRMRLLRDACETAPASLDEAQGRADALEAIRKLNKNLIRLGQTGRENLRSQLRQLNQGRAASRAYVRSAGS